MGTIIERSDKICSMCNMEKRNEGILIEGKGLDKIMILVKGSVIS